MPVDFQLAADARWTASSDSPRTVAPGESRRIDVEVNAAGLPAGTYRASLLIHGAGDARVQALDLVLMVTPPLCTPSRLEIAMLSLLSGFAVPAAFPADLEVQVRDNCGLPLTSANSTVTAWVGSSNPSAVAQLTSLRDGRWSGTLPPPLDLPRAVTVNLTASDPDRGLTGTLSLSGTLVQSAPALPLMTADGVTSLANYAVGLPLSPGGLIAATGTELAPRSVEANGFPLPVQLGVTRMQVADQEVPLLFAGSTQVNAVLPYFVAVNTLQQVSVRVGSRVTNRVEVAVAPAQPAVFTPGTGEAIAMDDDVMISPANPTQAGRIITIFCEGLGAVNQFIPPGEPAPGEPFAETLETPQVTIGGWPARVTFSGLVAFKAGLYRVKVEVPEGVTPGNAVPVVITSGGQPSLAATIAVQ